MRYLKRPTGASDNALMQLERKYGVTLPDDLRQFWLESDGPILWFGYKELQFFSISDVIEDYYNVSELMPGAVPICMDGCGNICIAHLASGRIDGYFVASSGDLEWEAAVRVSDNFFSLLHDARSPEQRLRKAGADG